MKYSECCFNISDTKKACVYLTEQCNLKCLYCFSNCKEYKCKNLAFERINELIAEFKKRKIEYIILSGGEPLLYDGIFDLIQMLTRENFTVSLCTNAVMATEEVCNKLSKCGLRKVTISLDRANSQSFEEITQVKGSYSSVVQGIKNFVSNSFDVTLNCVVYNNDIACFDSLISFAESMHVKEMCFTLAVCKSDKKFIFSEELVQDIYTQLTAMSTESNVSIEFNNPQCNSHNCPSNDLIFGVGIDACIGKCLVKNYLGAN